MNHSKKVDGRPAFQFYPDDWLADSALNICDLATQGAWMKLLCHMFRSPTRGVLLNANSMPIDAAGLCRLLAVSDAEAVRIRCELLETGTASSREDGAIYSRRMYREWCDANARSDAAKHAAEMRWQMRNHASSTSSPSSAPSPKPTKVPADSGAIANFVLAWNEMATANGLPPIRRGLGAKRSKMLNARLREDGWADDHLEALKLVPGSAFLLGTNDRNWKANAEWFLRETSVEGILVGKYGGGVRTGRQVKAEQSEQVDATYAERQRKQQEEMAKQKADAAKLAADLASEMQA